MIRSLSFVRSVPFRLWCLFAFASVFALRGLDGVVGTFLLWGGLISTLALMSGVVEGRRASEATEEGSRGDD